MPKYTISGRVTISCYTEVEAASPKQAREFAALRPMCSVLEIERMGETAGDVWSHGGELDGTPEIVSVEEI